MRIAPVITNDKESLRRHLRRFQKYSIQQLEALKAEYWANKTLRFSLRFHITKTLDSFIEIKKCLQGTIKED